MAKNHEIETDDKAHLLPASYPMLGQVTGCLLNVAGERRGGGPDTLQGRMGKTVAPVDYPVWSSERANIEKRTINHKHGWPLSA